MRRRVLVIGIGPGDPEQVTIQAIRGLHEAAAFFVADKGEDKSELEHLRREICERYIRDHAYRFVRYEDPVRSPDAPSYRSGVDQWHAERAAIYERLLREELAEGETGAFLVWGDPSLYDSTLRILATLQARGTLELDCEVIPGISSVQALAARHKIPLHPIGEPVLITTGRKLAQEGLPSNVSSAVVMLDGNCSFRSCADQDLEIYWGAYLGTKDEIIRAGELNEVMDEIANARAQARRTKGWVMDTYLLRRR